VLSLPEDGNRACFRNVVLHQKLDGGQSPKKKKRKENYISKGYLIFMICFVA
jgi:hypothetical protein